MKMGAEAEKKEKVPLKQRVEQFNAAYKKNMLTPSISRPWFYIAALLAFGLFFIYGVLGGDPGLYRDLSHLGFARSVLVCMAYVGIMSLLLWPLGIFLETVKRVNTACK
jgi:hypothetical protein